MSTDEFTDIQATREGGVPLLIGIFSPSGAGKTYSALRMATGIRSVVGGEIFGVDTEAGRMRHYADSYSFRWVEFKPPFSPQRYESAMLYCIGRGAKVIIFDSASHEHEGAGGVLEMHAEETKRLAKAWGTTEAKAQTSAWQEPKKLRRHFINTMMQQRINIIFCFRAREKLKIRPGKDPLDMGYMPIAGEELVFEMTVNCFLPPNARGVPDWSPTAPGEKAMTKLPGQFEEMFGALEGPLNEDVGRKLAIWAKGIVPISDVDGMAKTYDSIVADEATSVVAFEALEKKRQDSWAALNGAQKRTLKEASDAAAKRINYQTGESK
jgi:AAA domain-containing protein